ncbi:MAG: hypothetical protein ACRDX8_10000 [Acidimicrobiales bacterium]
MDTDTGITKALTSLLEHEKAMPSQALLEGLMELRANCPEPTLRLAAERVLRRCAPGSLSLDADLAELVEAAGDRRDQLVLLACLPVRVGAAMLPAGVGGANPGGVDDAEPRGSGGATPGAATPDWVGLATLGKIGAGLGVTGSRVAQIRDRAQEQVRAALGESSAALGWTLASLRRRLGGVSLVADAQQALLDHGLGLGDGMGAFALWLAGPYHPVPDRPGWLAIEPAELLAATQAFVAEDGGVHSLSEAEVELDRLGVGSRWVGEWLRAFGAGVMDGSVVLVTGRLSQAVERILEAAGQALTVAEIGSRLALGGREVETDALAKALGQARFRRLPADRVELSDWPPSPIDSTGSSTVAKTRPAATPTVDKPAEKHKAKPAKPTRARPARPAKPAQPTRARPKSVAASAEASLAGEEVQRSWLWVRVDTEVLRGGEADVPPATAELVGLQPSQRRTFSSRFGPVTLSREGDQTQRGSVRAIALASGATDGDTLMLGFAAGGDVAVEVHRPPAQPGRQSPPGSQTQPGRQTQPGSPDRVEAARIVMQGVT